MNITLAIIKNKIKSLLVEKETILIWSISGGIGLIVISSLWISSEKSVIGGFRKEELIGYYFLIYFLDQFVGWYVFWTVRDRIRDGSLSNYLLKPFSFIKAAFWEEFVYKAMNLTTHLLVGTLLLFFLKDNVTINLSINSLIQVIPAILNGIGIMFLSLFGLGSFTFFWDESHFAMDFHWILSLLFGGRLFPLSFLPENIDFIVKYNPFRFTYSFPAEVLQGDLSNDQYLLGLTVGTIWTILSGIFAYIIWTKGLKKYSAYGS